MQRICVRLRGIFTSNQTFYMSASLQAAAFVWSVIYVQPWQKHFFMESLKNLYFGKKKKKEEMISLGTGCLWPMPLLCNTCTSEPPALLRQRSVINRRRPKVIWVYVGLTQVLQIQMDITAYSFINDNTSLLKEAPMWRDAPASQ